MACCPGKTSPGPMRMAMTAAAAAVRVGVAFVTGKAVLARPETVALRSAHCALCVHNTEVTGKSGKVYHRCVKCGCWLDGLNFSKLKLATESCPLPEPKWEAE